MQHLTKVSVCAAFVRKGKASLIIVLNTLDSSAVNTSQGSVSAIYFTVVFRSLFEHSVWVGGREGRCFVGV